MDVAVHLVTRRDLLVRDYPLATALMRARNIKPSLFKNEVLGTADPLLTILFEGLWCEADREGRLEDRPLRLKAEILPYRNDTDVNALLTWLKDYGFIARYEANGLKVIQVLKFSDHQRPHNNEVESVLPAMDASKHNQGKKQAQPRKKALRSDSLLLIPDSGSLIPDPPSLEEEVRAPKRARSRNVPDDFEVTEAMRSWAKTNCPEVDIEAETLKFRDHEYRDPHGNWPAAWRTWMRRSPDFKPHANGRATEAPKRTGSWRDGLEDNPHADK